MNPYIIQDQFIEITVVECVRLRNTGFTRLNPYVSLDYCGTKFLTRVCSGGGSSPLFNERFMFKLIQGLQEINVGVWSRNFSDNIVGSGKIQLQEVLARGRDDRCWTIYSGSGRSAGEVKLMMRYTPPNAGLVPAPPPPPVAPPPNAGYPPSPQATMYPPSPLAAPPLYTQAGYPQIYLPVAQAPSLYPNAGYPQVYQPPQANTYMPPPVAPPYYTNAYYPQVYQPPQANTYPPPSQYPPPLYPNVGYPQGCLPPPSPVAPPLYTNTGYSQGYPSPPASTYQPPPPDAPPLYTSSYDQRVCPPSPERYDPTDTYPPPARTYNDPGQSSGTHPPPASYGVRKEKIPLAE